MHLEGQVRRGLVGHPAHQSENFLVNRSTGRTDPVHVVARSSVCVDDLTTNIEGLGHFVTNATGDGQTGTIINCGASSSLNGKINTCVDIYIRHSNRNLRVERAAGIVQGRNEGWHIVSTSTGIGRRSSVDNGSRHG
jgi:hypothetical protein